MSQLEQITLLVITGMAHAVLALALLFFHKPDEIRHEVRLWLLAQTLAGIAYTLFLWRKVGSLFWFSSLPNAMIALAYGLTTIALARFFRVRRIRYLVGVTAITTLAQLLLRELGLSEPVRLASVVLIGSLAQAVLCVLYVRQWRGGSALIRVLAAANGLAVFMFLLRATEALRASADYSFFHAGWGQTIGLLGLYVSALVNNFGFLLLVQERTDEELVRLSTLDPLTEALNRRSFIDGARQQLAMADCSLHPVSVLMCDIDHFKQINDRYGHHAGDDVIKAFVAVARATIRLGDSLGRWGGEELSFCYQTRRCTVQCSLACG